MESQSKKSSTLRALSGLFNGTISSSSDSVGGIDRKLNNHQKHIKNSPTKVHPIKTELSGSSPHGSNMSSPVASPSSRSATETKSSPPLHAPTARSSTSMEGGIGKRVSSKFAKYLSQTDDAWGLSNVMTPKSLCKSNRASTPTSSGWSVFPRGGQDPTYSRTMPPFSRVSSNQSTPRSAEVEIAEANAHISRIKKFVRILDAPVVDLNALRTLAWNGIPAQLRPIVWKYLLGYLPCNASRRDSTLQRKRDEYLSAKDANFRNGSDLSVLDQSIWRQIVLDVPRTNPFIPLYQNPVTQRILERILYVWASRHPASGYVQGISDLVTPFFQVFLSEYANDNEPMTYDVSLLDEPTLNNIEADSYWCLSKLLDGIQDNYIHAQPGIHRQINNLRELTQRIDEPLVAHLQAEGVDFMQFSFRWMNCLLMRELSITNIIRMWDTYLAEGTQGFSEFHLYVCAAFLVKWSIGLQQMEFQDILMFLQSIPTDSWTVSDIEILLSEAFLWKSLYSGAGAHLKR
ncbi:GTPase activating protein Gyp1 [Schizosaccharomyces octosporus yFS286]|uniref:GTPase activating protein Gyp1 n=1 Tax=Schizosaccharomyces octosporus (strain yFS286) TaxID=483514 RepID=S9RAK3_SCHOY|nr:GTPase activating protein Gyp1 [Schizosaccharomyces octosporus yFS286]EPX75155.1 GTPase activating protein Gyp1 [Schizosaccharomyces octosporus yFS286]